MWLSGLKIVRLWTPKPNHALHPIIDVDLRRKTQNNYGTARNRLSQLVEGLHAPSMTSNNTVVANPISTAPYLLEQKVSC